MSGYLLCHHHHHCLSNRVSSSLVVRGGRRQRRPSTPLLLRDVPKTQNTPVVQRRTLSFFHQHHQEEQPRRHYYHYYNNKKLCFSCYNHANNNTNASSSYYYWCKYTTTRNYGSSIGGGGDDNDKKQYPRQPPAIIISYEDEKKEEDDDTIIKDNYDDYGDDDENNNDDSSIEDDDDDDDVDDDDDSDDIDTAAVVVREPSPKKQSIRLSKLLSAYLQSVSRREVERIIKRGDFTMPNGQTMQRPKLPLTQQELIEEWCNTASSAKILKPHNGRTRTIPIRLTPEFVSVLFDSMNRDGDTATTNLLPPKVWLVHKLKGELVSESDPKDRPCLIPRLIQSGVGGNNYKKKQGDKQKQPVPYHLKPIGRLDYLTEGLILVTSCGKYKREMELPRNGLHRTYRVRVCGYLTDQKIKSIQRGVTINGISYGGMRVAPVTGSKNMYKNNKKTKKRKQTKIYTDENRLNSWIEITCTEGKNRQIRNVLGHLGLKVFRLIRISFGDYQLHPIPPGGIVEVPLKPIATQRRVGPLFQKKKKQQQQHDDERPPPIQWVHASDVLS